MSSCFELSKSRFSSLSTEDEYLSGMLRIRIMSATDIKTKTGIQSIYCDCDAVLANYWLPWFFSLQSSAIG